MSDDESNEASKLINLRLAFRRDLSATATAAARPTAAVVPRVTVASGAAATALAKEVLAAADPAPSPATAAPEPLFLDPQDPMRSAKEFAKLYTADGSLGIRFWHGTFYLYTGVFFRPLSPEMVRNHVWNFLDRAFRNTRDPVPFRPKTAHVNEVIDALKNCLYIDDAILPPTWLDTGESGNDWVTFSNVNANMRTLETRPHSHRFWSHSALDYPWDRTAEAPRWEQFTRELFEDDIESIEFLEEWMGYCMTGDIRFHKAAMFVGERRAGKSLIVDLIGKLVGPGAYVGLSFNDWMATPKSLQVLLGKRVGAFSDVRLKAGQMFGRNLAPGGLDHRSAEMLLKITGGDKISIGRMYTEAWEGTLPIKLMMTSNEVPNFNDPRGALPSRFIKLHFRKSFAAHPDVNLKDALIAELPGITRYCLGALRRLYERGGFVQPRSGLALEQAVIEAGDPFAAMVNELFVWDGQSTCTKQTVLAAMHRWCEARGEHILKSKLIDRAIGAKLRELGGPWAGLADAPRPNGAPRSWQGFRFRRESDNT